MNAEAQPSTIERLPVTAELSFYSLVLLIPLGLLSGILAGSRQDRPADNGLRALAFVATAIPPFILGLVLVSVFNVGLRWFPRGRTTSLDVIRVTSTSFSYITGTLTLDGLLNGRLDITLNALRHLVLPVITLRRFVTIT